MRYLNITERQSDVVVHSYHECAANKSSAAVWCCRVSMDQDVSESHSGNKDKSNLLLRANQKKKTIVMKKKTTYINNSQENGIRSRILQDAVRLSRPKSSDKLSKYSGCKNPSIMYTRLVQFRVTGVFWSLSQLSSGKRQGHTLERSPVHYRATHRWTTMHAQNLSYRQFWTTN